MIFVIDDIADSFDYKNKYAIIEYLREMAQESNFYQIILTHNFDFFRSIQERVLVNKWKASYMANKTDTEVILDEVKYSEFSNPFLSWKKRPKNMVQFIALIPFVRNILEYTGGDEEDMRMLTFCLHNKLSRFRKNDADTNRVLYETPKTSDITL